jgi:AcrR family transcriptional regulator
MTASGVTADTATGTRSKVTLETLVDAAADIAIRDGVDALTMRRLAQQCDVGVMTLYGYVKTKEELLGLLADRFLADTDLPDPAAPWRDQLSSIIHSVRAAMLEHPALVPIIATQRLHGRSAHRGAEAVFAALGATGLPDSDTLAAFAALTSFTVGSVQRELGTASPTTAPDLAALGPAEFPYASALLRELATHEPLRDFEDGLRFVVDGIAARIAP